MTSGIYKIENKKTGQIYIGQSKNIEDRFRKHCNVLAVDVDIATYGVENFSFSILEETNENLSERERFWIDGYGAYENDYHYNLTPGGHIKPDNLSASKYILWDTYVCAYDKRAMYGDGNEKGLRPRKCFYCMFGAYRIKIGGFYDFYSCEIISDLIDNFINN